MTKSIAAGRTRAWVDIDLDALARNAQRFQAHMQRPLLPMVKADGYGLGAEAVAHALEPLSPWGYGVATVEEAATLRRAGIGRPILLFTPLYPQILHACLTWGLRPSIGDPAMLGLWLESGGKAFHLAVDTGMGRSGVPWHDAEAWAQLHPMLADQPAFEGMYSHLHSAGDDPDASAVQMARFQAVIDALPRRPEFLHIANSAADPSMALDLVRPGIHLYGGPVAGVAGEPVVKLQARVVAVRRVRPGDTVSYGATWQAALPTTIATIAIGYADGLHRALSGTGRVELRDTVCPIAGLVTMDLTMVDVGDLPVQVGNVATVFGGRVSLEDQAARAGTIPYELLTAMGPRLPRLYRRTA
ncbi:MAG: alanine racemase [Gemmatimonadota bacterium]|nr:alanine racemase [Gemmatimonadota bacterium]